MSTNNSSSSPDKEPSELEPPNKRAKIYEENASTNVNAYILPAGIGKVRCELFNKQIKNLGGTTFKNFDPLKLTHVIVDEKMDVERLCRILSVQPSSGFQDVKVVQSLWLSACIRSKQFVPTKEFELELIKKLQPTSDDFKCAKLTDSGSHHSKTVGISLIDKHSEASRKTGSEIGAVGLCRSGNEGGELQVTTQGDIGAGTKMLIDRVNNWMQDSDYSQSDEDDSRDATYTKNEAHSVSDHPTSSGASNQPRQFVVC